MALLLIAGMAFLALIMYTVLFVGHRDRRLPPGPPTLPVIGNLHQIPTKGSYFAFTEWANKYGGIFSLKLGSGTAIVLTDRRLVKQLIDKKSSIYSNRPHSFVSHDLITGGDHILIAHYGKNWQNYRKYISQHFKEKMVEEDHLPVQNAEASQMLYDFLTAPENHMKHPKRYSNSIAMSTIWGVRTPTIDTPHMKRLYDMMERWSIVMEAGNTPPVELFPFLHYIPESWLGNWRKRASRVGDEMNALYGELLDQIYARREKSGSMNSFMDRVLDDEKKLDFTRHQLYFMGGTMMEGASDTSSAIILAGIQAMAKWPDVQKKAQAEIDSVVGPDRSPTWDDYAKLPYIAAVVKEAMRWRPVTPLAFPHCVDEGESFHTRLLLPAIRDRCLNCTIFYLLSVPSILTPRGAPKLTLPDDWIDGNFIPRNSIIFINVWGLHHSPSQFANPSVFDPAHYYTPNTPALPLASELALSPDPADRDHYGYGSGRRMCPGIHLAERNMWLAFAKLLWGFEFKSGKGEDGVRKEIDTDPKTAYSEGFLVCAREWNLEVVVRGKEREGTIRREFEEAKENIFSPFG